MHLLTEVGEARPASDEKPSASPAYAWASCPNEASAPGDPANVWELFEQSASLHGSNQALGWRPIVNGNAQPFAWITYTEALERASYAGSAFMSLGVKKGGAVGVYATNSPEWMLALKGIDFCGAQCVPLYDTFGPDAVKFIIKHSGLTVLCTSSDNLKALEPVLPEVADQLVQVIVWSSPSGTPAEEAVKAVSADAHGIPIVTWGSSQAFGKANPRKPAPGSTEDLCTIMYTSGTTGEPKGVEISHRAVLATVGALHSLLQEYKLDLGPNDAFLSYLPLAHIFDRVAEELFLGIGASIGYWQGSPKALLDDVVVLRPTIFVGVPRIFDRLYSGVTDKVSSSSYFKRTLFDTGFFVKECLLYWGVCTVPGVDDLIFSPVKQRLGGRVRVVVSGGAPIARHVEHFLKVTMCCPVTQGYGLTETCGPSLLANPYDSSQEGTAGAPVAGLQMRLESVPEMGYDALADPPRGEVLLKGPSVFTAYHKRPDLTKEVKDSEGWFHSGDVGEPLLGSVHDTQKKSDSEGWFHSGDVGELLPSGACKIIDRLKNIFKLAQGEYVAAEKLENQYKKCTLIDQIWVYGDSESAYLVAVVVPNPASLVAWAEQNGLPSDIKALYKNEKAAMHVQSLLEQEGRSAGLKGFEIVKMVHLSPHAFAVENGLQTPSFKLKRPALKKKFEEEIKHMYSVLGS